MRIIWGTSIASDLNDYLASWAAERVPGCRRGFGNCRTMGVMDGDELVAVMVYHHWDPMAAVVEISGAATDSRWLTRPILSKMFSYPFIDMGCQLVAMRVSEHNKRLHRMLAAYGFKAYRIPRLRGRHEDDVIFTLTDEAWRTNKFNTRSSGNGQELQRAAAA